MMLNKNSYLFASIFFLFLALFFGLLFVQIGFFGDNVYKQLIVVLLTLFVQIPFVLSVVNRYSGSNAYLLHPLFFINGVIVLRFFVPFIFFLFNQNLFFQPWCGWDFFSYSLKPLLVFCVSVVFFNFCCYFLSKYFFGFKDHFDFKNVFSGVRCGYVKVWIVLYILVWIARVFSIFTGTYWHSFLSEDLILRRSHFARFTSFVSFFTAALSPVVWFVFWAFYFVKWWSRKYIKTLLFFLAVLEIVYFLPSGSKYHLLVPILTYFFAGFLLRRGVVRWFAIFLVALILLWPIHSAFRTSSVSRRVCLDTVRYISNPLAVEKGYLFLSLYSFIARLEAFSGYVAISQQCDDFLHGKSYLPILVAPVPRPLWPGKPASVNLNRLGRRYGVINKVDFVTSPGLSVWGEAYLNFGYLGLFILFFFLSIVSLFVFKFAECTQSVFAVALAFYVVFRFVGSVDSFLSGLVMDILKFAVVFGILSLVLKSQESGAAGRPFKNAARDG